MGSANQIRLNDSEDESCPRHIYSFEIKSSMSNNENSFYVSVQWLHHRTHCVAKAREQEKKKKKIKLYKAKLTGQCEINPAVQR
jgi:hypothetical protein